jgi:phosphoribosylanthranilate isomerase
VFVKICGINSQAALDAAVGAGADAVGFVFAESPRRVTPTKARSLVADLSASVVRVAVMRHPTEEEVGEVLELFDPDWIQTDHEDFATLSLPAKYRALPVYRNGQIEAESTLPRRLLFEGTISGTGSTADWAEAARIAKGRELMLAGGLSPDNVSAAVEAVRPWGVDVSSGVESSRGRKDEEKIADFVARVRALENTQ